MDQTKHIANVVDIHKANVANALFTLSMTVCVRFESWPCHFLIVHENGYMGRPTATN